MAHASQAPLLLQQSLDFLHQVLLQNSSLLVPRLSLVWVWLALSSEQLIARRHAWENGGYRASLFEVCIVASLHLGAICWCAVGVASLRQRIMLLGRRPMILFRKVILLWHVANLSQALLFKRERRA